MEFLGSALTMVPNLPAATIVVAPSTHIKFGFDDSGDETNIRTIYLGETTGDDVYRYKARMKTDINHVQGQDILLISPDITAGS
jgi:predicted P-loop ATPase/GTPase